MAASSCVQWHGFGCSRDAQMPVPHYPSIPMHPAVLHQYHALPLKDNRVVTQCPLQPKVDPQHSMHVPSLKIMLIH